LGVRDKKAIKASIGINFATRKARSVCLIEFILRAHLTALTPALSQGTLGTDPQSNPVQPQRARAVVITLSCRRRRRLLLPTRKLISRSAMAKVALSLSPSDPYFLSRAKLKLKSDLFFPQVAALAKRMAGRKKGEATQLQIEVGTQDEWDKLLAKEGLIGAD